jgi:hypothetical protein
MSTFSESLNMFTVATLPKEQSKRGRTISVPAQLLATLSPLSPNGTCSMTNTFCGHQT